VRDLTQDQSRVWPVRLLGRWLDPADDSA